jgi:GT2 family glycosyltransferase
MAERVAYDTRDVVGQIHAPRPPAPAAAGALRRGLAVVICTYRRAASLERFIDSLREHNGAPAALVPAQLIIVDASPDDAAETMVQQRDDLAHLAEQVSYFRVAGELKGLTRQRNFGMRWVQTDLLAFFDDDIVLLPGCLRALDDAYRAHSAEAVGIGAFTVGDELMRPEDRLRWQLRQMAGMLPALRPGRYYRSGMQTTWAFMPSTDAVVEGDWLHGCAMLWKTEVARAEGFNEQFLGYSNGEDLEFSLRMKRHGRLYVAGRARLLHIRDSEGRPDVYKMGYMNLYNAYYIHQHCVPRRRWWDAIWFFYAYGVDSLIRLGVSLVRRRADSELPLFLRGRLDFFVDLLRGKVA